MIHSRLVHAATRSARLLVAGFLLTLTPVLTAADGGQTGRIAAAADEFLELLNDEQRGEVVFAFDNDEQRRRWSNLPVSMGGRGGLRMGDLTEVQRDAVMRLLAVTLSPMGYEKIVGIVESDEALKQNSSGGPAFGRDEFYVSFLGRPSATEPWMIQFGGHHLGLNVTLAGDQGVLTPSLIAVQPAKFTLNGKNYRPLERETAVAFELVESLNEAQREKAVLGFEMRDLVLGPGHDGETVEPEGIKASDLNAAQRDLLVKLVGEWSGIIHEAAAARKLAEVREHMDETWFAWSGPLEAGKGYFRVQGPTVVIEYAPQRLGGDVTQHIHTMFRDPTNDYGAKFVGR